MGSAQRAPVWFGCTSRSGGSKRETELRHAFASKGSPNSFHESITMHRRSSCIPPPWQASLRMDLGLTSPHLNAAAAGTPDVFAPGYRTDLSSASDDSFGPGRSCAALPGDNPSRESLNTVRDTSFAPTDPT